MKKNVGSIDRVIRGILGIALIAAFFLGSIPGALGIVAALVGAVLLFTAAIGWCPPYTLLGINTCNPKKG